MTASNIAELQPKTAIAPRAQAFSLAPQTFEQALTLADYLAASDMVPKDFQDKPGNCLVAIQWGVEIGLQPLQAMQNIAVINGRPSLWGDAVIALARNSPVCEYIIETDDGQTATCKVKRRGEAEQVRTFSMNDAKSAGLAGKAGPWTQYPKRMRQMRARAFAIRDVFPDVLKGLPVAEEIMYTPVRDMGPAHEIVPEASPELRQGAQEAAAKGVAAYQEYWTSITKEVRKLLQGDHEANKLAAQDADKARTVEPTPDPAPAGAAVKSFDEVMAMLCAAKNLDQLYVGGDWIGSIDDFDQQEILNAKFSEMSAKLGGAA